MVTGNFGPEIEKTLKILATDQIQAESTWTSCATACSRDAAGAQQGDAATGR